MIEYVVSQNIDDRVCQNAVRILEGGGLIALPTDTSWLVVCSFKSKEGIKKLRKISGDREERLFTLLCSDISQFGEFCSIDNSRFRLIKRLSPGPYVFILKTLLGTEKALEIRRKEAGVRIPDHSVPLAIINALGFPLYSVTAKRNMIQDSDFIDDDDEEVEDGKLPPIPEDSLFEGGWEMEDIPGIDLILDTGEELPRLFSTILDLTGDEVVLIRQGAGSWPV
ncbi:MAG: L-threonylcarbamoyladenylate synthase [Treponema sp.]|jgi:tRNA threonylcarbamoyl adenosine modification protein (Sua5/YciO/YrdC/YwlC family)|nr:L-threonylcarbamoyladenylate synthase [Treponema sp.]